MRPNPDIHWGTQPDDVCSLDEFCEQNEEIADELRDALATDGRYVGGGGAAPMFEITLVPQGPPPRDERHEEWCTARESVTPYCRECGAEEGM